jgi:methionine aminopeptidase
MDDDRVLTDSMITKYNTAASICGRVYNKIKDKVLKDNERDILALSTYGNNCIQDEFNGIFKKEHKHIAFPVSISLNNCVGNYIYDHTNKNSEYNTIKDTDIIKVELGVSIGGCISMLAETFTINDNPEIERINVFLNKLQKELLKKIKHEETADEMRIIVESKCTDNDVFPIENCMSYQQWEEHLTGESLKYMILNYRKYYDNNDYLISPENINYEFEEHDIYTINLSVMPSQDESENNIKYKSNDDSHIYRLNEFTYNLKLKSSKNFYSQVKSKHRNYAFEISPYLQHVKNRMGLRECLQNNIIDSYPIKYVYPVIFLS